MKQYNIYKTTPNGTFYQSATFSTLERARAHLECIRKAYAKDAPRGKKRERAQWASDRMSINCETTSDIDPNGRGDLITYSISEGA